MHITVLSRSPEDTRRVGSAVAECLAEGDVVALAGDLGAGKTAFVQGAAKELGVTTPVTSPTFVLVREHHDARIPLIHVDVYRMRTHGELDGLGDNVLAPDVVTMVEWGDVVSASLPPDRLDVKMRVLQAAADTDAADAPREITLCLHGDWSEKSDALQKCLANAGIQHELDS